MSSRLPPAAWPQALVRIAMEGALLSRHGDHGVPHWARVGFHGVSLARQYDVNPVLPALFGLFHDCRRRNEHVDPHHGPRAALLVQTLASQDAFAGLLSAREIDWLQVACDLHSEGHIDAPRAVQVCWDADRLDLGRVGITPLPGLLCTEAARDPRRIHRATAWAQGTSSWRATRPLAGPAHPVLAVASPRSRR